MLSGAMSSGLKQSLAFARRHASRLIYALALIGVPLAVIYGTGGPHTIGFWAMAVLWLPISMIGLMPFTFLLFLPLIPILWLADKLLAGRLEKNLDRAMPVLWVVLALVVYVRGADLGFTGHVWLPTPWPNVGVLLVMGSATAVFVGLMWLGGILEALGPPARPVYRRRWDDIPEPDDEYWSDQMVEGWRAWRWEDGRLCGVFDAWRSPEYQATCDECREVPSWSHSCGIYAVKNPKSVHRFHQGSSVVGRVEMWGSVIEHEHGYRAARARITDLWTNSEALAQLIQNEYPVPVHPGTPQTERKEATWRT